MKTLQQFLKPLKADSMRSKIRKLVREHYGSIPLVNKKVAEEIAELVFPWLNDLEHKWSEKGLPTKNQQAILDQLWESINLLWDYCGVNEK